MVRSIWKGIYVANELRNYGILEHNEKSEEIIITDSRSTVIVPYFLDKIIYIHNGNKYIGIKINKKMLGRKLGEYAITKKPAVYPKDKKKGK